MNHYTADQLASFPWIVSTDTLRLDHLADAYLGALDQLGQDVPEPFRSDLQQCAAYAPDAMGPEPREPWQLAVDWAFDRLGELAPTGFDFGASEGDGACFGFWLSEDWADALEHLGLDADDPTGWAALIAELEADGIDPDNVEDSYQGRAEGWSEERAGAHYAEELAYETSAGGCDWGGDGKGWPLTCIDRDAAWRELEMGDGYRLHDLGGGDWLVFRNY
jgi:hypothetical protein